MEVFVKSMRQMERATLELGGTISGEHGVGITKSKYISAELRAAWMEVTRKIKKVFDPNNIMNPGKILS